MVWFDEYSKLERVVVSLNLLECHLVVQDPKKGHPYKNGKAKLYQITVTRNKIYSNIISYYQLVLVNKMVEVPVLVCGQVAFGDTRCGRSYLGQELAVVIV